MISFMESKEKMRETERCLDSQLWHACAGSMVQMPLKNSKVFYFPQGHSEHSCGNVDFRNFPRIPAYIPCRVSSVSFMADLDTDEVFAKMRLSPVTGSDAAEVDHDEGGAVGSENQETPTSFAKTLTQSDANNGGGFSVPRYCAETIFPRLDYSADPPVQTILAKDVHGETWKFRHIYRGTPRRHLLTTGWSTFVNHKKLLAGDSIVFMRAESGDLCVGIRRAKRGISGGTYTWNLAGGNYIVPYGGFASSLRDDEKNNNVNWIGRGRVKAEDVVEAASLAASGHPFEVVYYPRGSTPEFCVKASLVKVAMQIRWCLGMRFKMAFETEDSSRISWFMGTISSVQVVDPIWWPDSPWRLLQVAWDEPDLLQNVKRVSPWLVELVSNMPAIHLSHFSPPRKKMRLPQHSDHPFDGQIPMPPISHQLVGSSNPFGCLHNTTPAGMQGARHAQYGLSSSSLHVNKQLQLGLFPVGFLPHDRYPTGPSSPLLPTPASNENISCLLTMGNPTQGSAKPDHGTAVPFVLFGKPILPENQISLSCSSDTVSPTRTGNSSSDENVEKTGNTSDGSGCGLNQNEVPEHSSCEGIQPDILETGHCKVFMESEDVGRTLDLSQLSSYEQLYRKIADMFGIDASEILNRVLCRDAEGRVKPVGDQPFSNFIKTTRRLTILADSSSDNVEV